MSKVFTGVEFGNELLDPSRTKIKKCVQKPKNNPQGVYETNYKVKKVKNLLLGEIWPPSDLLFLE